ncbi:hypothetical protein BZG36_00875 [Bifiguratus adelaidae]|uniref:Glycoside hydrolase family 125 protein n=1 Tax=Bifiguratus adelaidae TaxID=1938954 RepID=A0A261Y5G0_9FUNG|nr:hypothetical protein BZG36_00875 [Bifiguratus adelaidae]
MNTLGAKHSARITTFFSCVLSISILSYLYHPHVESHRQWSPALPVNYPVLTPFPPLRLPHARPPLEDRLFHSTVIEDVITEVTAKLSNSDLATMFENCFPNTLDTTIAFFDKNHSHPRTFVVTGDIPAMWIRDSTNQVTPYLRYASADPQLKLLIKGVINLQAASLVRFPYANAFKAPADAHIGHVGYSPYPSVGDDGLIKNHPEGASGHSVLPPYDPSAVWESKYELDSLASFIKLSVAYYRSTGDTSHFYSAEWQKAMLAVLDVIVEETRGTWESSADFAEIGGEPWSGRWSVWKTGYRFMQSTKRPTETLGQDGLGGVVRHCGLVKSAFRPSDDATTFPFLVPANAMLSAELNNVATTLYSLTRMNPSGQPNVLLSIATRSSQLSTSIRNAIYEYAVYNHPVFGPIFAYEVDGHGSMLFMDDANIPSLLALPYLGFLSKEDPIYKNTRAFILSEWNPWFFRGTGGSAGSFEGVGGPHVGRNMVWPMSLLVRILTSNDREEVKIALEMIRGTTDGTGFIHESVHVNQAHIYTRKWFAWANTLFGETILYILEQWPDLLTT